MSNYIPTTPGASIVITQNLLCFPLPSLGEPLRQDLRHLMQVLHSVVSRKFSARKKLFIYFDSTRYTQTISPDLLFYSLTPKGTIHGKDCGRNSKSRIP